MSADWYGRQFGDCERFAIAISFGRDPHPTGDDVFDAGWGGLSIWVRGRCLTRNVSSEGGISDEIRWSLIDILRWLIDVRARLINEEPFPDTTNLNQVRDACDWHNATDTPLLTLTEAEEDEWFLRRSDWRHHHALRRADDDVALPNVIIRRLGDFIEISWDNETWGTSRRGLTFIEQRGTTLVAAEQTASVLHTALVDVTRTLAEQSPMPDLLELAAAARGTSAHEDDWQWLVHPQTARVIIENMPSLRDQLNHHTETQRSGLYVPHSPATLLLRQARLVSVEEITTLLKAAQDSPDGPVEPLIQKLIRPTEASTINPWKDGYERARDVRDAMGWGDEPTPDLREWMRSHRVALRSQRLPSAIDLITTRTEDLHCVTVINPQAQLHLRREISHATALGHLLFDMTPAAVDGAWEHWPTAARARAFAVMLLLPDDGVRDVLGGRRSVDASDVKRVMERFRTGPHATTYHLMNRGFISDDERRIDILRELVA